jgi:hypothetical protein
MPAALDAPWLNEQPGAMTLQVKSCALAAQTLLPLHARSSLYRSPQSCALALLVACSLAAGS